MIWVLLPVALPFLLAALLAVLPSARVRAWTDLLGCGAVLALTVVLQGQVGIAPEPLRADGLGAFVALLIGARALAVRWRDLRRPGSPDRSSGRSPAAGQAVLGGLLLAALASDPLLTWFALTVALSAALWPALPRDWNGVIETAAALGLVLFGLVTGPAGAGAAVLGTGCLVVGLACLAPRMPDLLVLAPVLIPRMRLLVSGTQAEQWIDALLLALGLGGALLCGILLLVRPGNRRQLALLTLGQGSVAVFAFGLDTAEAAVAGLVQIMLLTLTQAALALSQGGGPARVAAIAGLGGLPPLGVFPGLALVVLATARHDGRLLLPLSAALLAMGWAAIQRLPVRQWTMPVTLSPAWLPLALLLLTGLLMPEPVADWLRAIAIEGRS